MQKKITFYVFFVFFKIPKFLDGVMGCWSTVHKGTPVGERLSEFPFPLIHYSLSASVGQAVIIPKFIEKR
ncbi:MAG: hypothetical protein ACTSX0_09335 [Promethearchaeota archaeon]